MLTMVIATWEPEKTQEVMRRRAEVKVPEGLKVFGEWVDLRGGRIFRLVDAGDDPRVTIAANFPWFDLCKIEGVPVMEAEELMKLPLPGSQEKGG